MAKVIELLLPCIVMTMTSATMDTQSKKQLAALVEHYTTALGAGGCCFAINPADNSQLVGFQVRGKGKSVIAPAKQYTHDDNSFEMGLVVDLSPAENTDVRKIYPAAIAKKDLNKEVTVRATVKITGTPRHFTVAPINKDNVVVEVGGEIVKKDKEAAKYTTFVDHAAPKIQSAIQKILNEAENGPIWSPAMKLVQTSSIESASVETLGCWIAHWKKIELGRSALGFRANPQLTGFSDDAAMKIVDGRVDGKAYAIDYVAVYKADDNKAGRAKFPAMVANLAKGEPLKIQATAFVVGEVGYFNVRPDSHDFAAFVGEAMVDAAAEANKYKALVDATNERMATVIDGFLGQSTGGDAWRGLGCR